MKDLRTLVSKAKAGNKEAFAELYEATKDRAYFIAARYIDEADIADVLQDAYIAAMQGLKSFDDTKPFEPWLHTIVRNKCIDFLRKKKAVTMDAEVFAGIEDSEAILPAEYLEDAEKRRDVLAIIDKLPSAQRITVNLYYLDGQSVSEVAATMGCPVSTVKSRLQYARKAIRDEVLMEEQKGNKLYGVAGTPFLAELFRREMESGFHKMPPAMSAQVSQGIASSLATGGAAGAVGTATSIGGKIMAMSVGAKVAIAGICAATLIGAVAVPVYIHNENEKTVMAMAVIEQEEADRAASKAAEIERIAQETEASRVAAESKTAAESKAAEEKAEAERLASETEQERIAAEEAEAERLAAEQAEAERLEAEQAAAEQAQQVAAQEAQSAANNAYQSPNSGNTLTDTDEIIKNAPKGWNFSSEGKPTTNWG